MKTHSTWKPLSAPGHDCQRKQRLVRSSLYMWTRLLSPRLLKAEITPHTMLTFDWVNEKLLNSRTGSMQLRNPNQPQSVLAYGLAYPTVRGVAVARQAIVPS